MQNEIIGLCTSFDDALALTGYGRFHHYLFGLCSLCLLSSGLQSGLASYIFSAAQNELNISSVELGYLHMAFMVGSITSAFFWGVSADLFGRRKILLIAMTLDFITTCISCLIPSFSGIAICRFLNGFWTGAPSSITLTYLGEFYLPKTRVRCLCFCSVFFTVAWLFLPIISYLVLPLPIDFQLGYLQVTTWRVLLFFLVLPELFCVLGLAMFPESPKFWYNKNNFKKALHILKSVHKGNKNSNKFPVIYLNGPLSQSTVSCDGKIWRLLADLYNQTLKLFKKPHNKTLLVMSIIFFTNMFGYFGLGLWLPQLFKRIHYYEITYPTGKTTLGNLANLNMTDIKDAESHSDTDMLMNNSIVWGVCLLGNILSGYCSGKVNLKVIPILTMTVGGLSCLVLFWLNSSWQYLMISCIFQTTMATGNMALASSAVAYFPTSIGAMGLCITLLAGRAGAIFSAFSFGSLLDTNCEIAIFLVAGFVLFGSAVCWFLPKAPTNCNE